MEFKMSPLQYLTLCNNLKAKIKTLNMNDPSTKELLADQIWEHVQGETPFEGILERVKQMDPEAMAFSFIAVYTAKLQFMDYKDAISTINDWFHYNKI